MKRKKKMPEPEIAAPPPEAEVVKDRVDVKNDIQMQIARTEDGQSLSVFIRAPVLADVIRKMTTGNYRKDAYATVYTPILQDIVESEGKNVITRPAITKITRLFVSGTDFLWEEAPRAILLANPDKLAEGYTITYKVDKPVPPDVVKKWGKQFMDGCHEILANARPFKMNWVMSETR